MKAKSIMSSAAVALLFFTAFAQEPSPVPVPPDATLQEQSTPVESNRERPQGERTIVNIKSRRVMPVHVGDSTVYAYVGNVVAYHNGAVMLCDSAVRYDENKIECFYNVLINKDSTYVYGDRVFYDRLTNTAQVFSPLIKMIDGQAVLYTYNFRYNTLSNVGEYYGGGTMSQGQTLLESDRGYYYGETRDAVCVGDVELRDSTYLIRSDSLGFNMDTEVATFYKKTYIWNEKDEILSANSGWYDTRSDHYHFMSDAYVLSEDQEVWAEDIDYKSDSDNVVLKRNIQILDEEQKVLAFGDYGRYWGERGDAMLTDNPSVISYYEKGDSIYMRADSIFMYVIDSTSIYSADYVGNVLPAETEADSGEELFTEDLPMNGTIEEEAASVSDIFADGVEVPADAEDISAQTEEELPVDDNTGMDLSQAVDSGEEEFSDVAAASESIGPEDSEDTDESEPVEVVTEGEIVVEGAPDAAIEENPDRPLTKKELRRQRREARRQEREERREEEVAERVPETEVGADTLGTDVSTVDGLPASDETAQGEVPETDEVAAEEAPESEEEIERVIVGYRNVKIYRSDMQAICDSLVSFSRDSTIHLYRDPVMWNGANQIKSDVVTVYTKDEALDRAVFNGGADHGNPVMSAELDRYHYNQITGKVIEALFRDNEIYQTDVVGNAQTYYYMQDDETGALQSFLVLTCSDITFIIVDQDIDTIIFRGDPVYSIYPMNMIPESQPQRLPNFVWEGEKRPFKKEVFDRTIRSSQRARYEKIPQPGFPLTEKIDEYRLRLIGDGLWKDRDDDITYDAREYMQRLRMQGL